MSEVAMKTLRAFTLLTLLAGCKVAATSEDYRWSVKAASPVVDAPGSKLTFVVEARAPDGRVITDVPYIWMVEWVGVHGIRHQGWSGREERIQVKGDPGPAFVRILAASHGAGTVEVARASFEVTGGTPPAK
jgi:hypothetical protein